MWGPTPDWLAYKSLLYKRSEKWLSLPPITLGGGEGWVGVQTMFFQFVIKQYSNIVLCASVSYLLMVLVTYNSLRYMQKMLITFFCFSLVLNRIFLIKHKWWLITTALHTSNQDGKKLCFVHELGNKKQLNVLVLC